MKSIMKSMKYYIEKKSKEPQSWNDGYFTYGIETNKKRAIKMAEEIIKKDKRNVRVKGSFGKIILELKL